MSETHWVSGRPTWWEMSAPLMIGVQRRMGLQDPPAEEIWAALGKAHEHWLDWRDLLFPPPDEKIVDEVLEELIHPSPEAQARLQELLERLSKGVSE